MDWRLILSAVEQVSPPLYVLSTILAFFASFLLAWKYHIFVRKTSISRSIPFMMKVNLISRFYGLFLPTALGPVAVRWFKVTKNKDGRAFFLAASVFERLSFYFVLLVFSFFFLTFDSSGQRIMAFKERMVPVLSFGILLVSGSMVYFTSQSLRSCTNSLIIRIFRSTRIGQKTVAFLGNFSLKDPTPAFYAAVLCLSVLWQFFFVVRVYLLFEAAVIPLSFTHVAWIGSCVLLLQMLPISFAGIGIREGAYAFLLSLFGLPPEKGVLIGLLFLSQMLILATVGGLLELMEK